MASKMTKFSKSAGVEIRPAPKESVKDSGTTKSGSIQVRGFNLQKGQKGIMMSLNPEEGSLLSDGIRRILKNQKGSCVITHKFNEQTSTLKVEAYAKKDGGTGYMVAVGREQETVRVGVTVAGLSHVAKYLDKLSVDQCWATYTSASGEESEVPTKADDSEVPSSEDDDLPF